MAVAGLLALVAAAPATEPERHECTTCHAALDQPRLSRPADQYIGDVHWERGFTCAACHGGDPADPTVSGMDPGKGYLGVPARERIPQLCARCHADAALMRRYDPSLPVDQLAQYRTSVHGRRLVTQGDTNVATCADCHTPHAIRPAADPTASVHPLRLPGTCGKCHADKSYMAGYPIPIDQLADYRASVHWRSVSEDGNLSAPVCNDCHGDHGATPPGVDAVANACRQCHGVIAEHYDKSAHAAVFPSMGLLGCASCHGEHRIEPAGAGLLGLGDDAVCGGCHAADDAGGKTAAAMALLLGRLLQQREAAQGVLQRAEHAGMEVSEAQFELTKATQSLVAARAAVHTNDLQAVEAPVEEGLAIAERALARGHAALEELEYRRRGLAVALLLILLVIVALVLTIRRIERGPGGGPRVVTGGHS